MTGDSYTPKQGSRVILYLKPHAEGYEGDRIQGKVLSVVSYRAPTWTTNHGDVVKGDEEDRLRVQLQTSWGVAGVPLDEVQMYTNLDAEERRLEAAERAGLIRRPVTDSKVVLQKGRVGTHKGRAKPVMEKSVPACGKCARRLAANNEGLEIG